MEQTFSWLLSPIALLFGKGRGVFSTSTAYVGLPDLSAVAVGDFNQDGKPDLAVSDTFDDVIGIMQGEGGGRFLQPEHLYPVDYAVAIAAGKFRNNGKLDLAVLSWGGGSKIEVFLGDGDGSFFPEQTVTINEIYPAWITLGDFNGDGILDLALTSAGDYANLGTVNILLGNGDGSFRSPVGYGSGNYLRGAVFGNFNGDGKLNSLCLGTMIKTSSCFWVEGTELFAKRNIILSLPTRSRLRLGTLTGTAIWT